MQENSPYQKMSPNDVQSGLAGNNESSRKRKYMTTVNAREKEDNQHHPKSPKLDADVKTTTGVQQAPNDENVGNHVLSVVAEQNNMLQKIAESSGEISAGIARFPFTFPNILHIFAQHHLLQQHQRAMAAQYGSIFGNDGGGGNAVLSLSPSTTRHITPEFVDEEDEDDTEENCLNEDDGPEDLTIGHRDSEDLHCHNTCSNGYPSSYVEQFKQVSQLYELSSDPKRKAWLNDWLAFMNKIGKPINRAPIMAKKVLDLYELYCLVVKHGGIVEVINKKLWGEITSGLNLPKTITSAAFTLRMQYQKYLYDYECAQHHFSQPNELEAAVNANKRDGHRNTPNSISKHNNNQSPRVMLPRAIRSADEAEDASAAVLAATFGCSPLTSASTSAAAGGMGAFFANAGKQFNGFSLFPSGLGDANIQGSLGNPFFQQNAIQRTVAFQHIFSKPENTALEASLSLENDFGTASIDAFKTKKTESEKISASCSNNLCEHEKQAIYQKPNDLSQTPANYLNDSTGQKDCQIIEKERVSENNTRTLISFFSEHKALAPTQLKIELLGFDENSMHINLEVNGDLYQGTVSSVGSTSRKQHGSSVLDADLTADVTRDAKKNAKSS